MEGGKPGGIIIHLQGQHDQRAARPAHIHPVARLMAGRLHARGKVRAVGHDPNALALHRDIGLAVKGNGHAQGGTLHGKRGLTDDIAVAGAEIHPHGALAGQRVQIHHGAHHPVAVEGHRQVVEPHAVGAGVVGYQARLLVHERHGVHIVADGQGHQVGNGAVRHVGQVDHAAVEGAALQAVVLVKKQRLGIHLHQRQAHRGRQLAGIADVLPDPHPLGACGKILRHIFVAVQTAHIQRVHVDGEAVLRQGRHGRPYQQRAQRQAKPHAFLHGWYLL